VLIGFLVRDSAAGRAAYEALLQEVRLVHVLDRVTGFGEGCCKRLDAHRASPVVLDKHSKEAAVHVVEACLVHLEALAGKLDDLRVDRAIAFDLREVSHAAQEAVRHAGSAA